MKKLSLVLYIHYLSNKTVGFSINQQKFKKYIDDINKYQNEKITFYTVEKKYSHVKNHQLLISILEYFKNKEIIIFNKKIKNISDFEIDLLKNNLHMKINGFEHEKALIYLVNNNLLETFLNNNLYVNIVHYYSEYSKDFGERTNIKNEQEIVNNLEQVEKYLENPSLLDEYKSQSVYNYSKKAQVISFYDGDKQFYLSESPQWLKEIFDKNKHKTTGFPYAKGKVFEESFLNLLKLANEKIV